MSRQPTNPPLEHATMHCSACRKQIVNVAVCSQCKRSAYCGDTCLDADRELHKNDCASWTRNLADAARPLAEIMPAAVVCRMYTGIIGRLKFVWGRVLVDGFVVCEDGAVWLRVSRSESLVRAPPNLYGNGAGIEPACVALVLLAASKLLDFCQHEHVPLTDPKIVRARHFLERDDPDYLGAFCSGDTVGINVLLDTNQVRISQTLGVTRSIDVSRVDVMFESANWHERYYVMCRAMTIPGARYVLNTPKLMASAVYGDEHGDEHALRLVQWLSDQGVNAAKNCTFSGGCSIC